MRSTGPASGAGPGLVAALHLPGAAERTIVSGTRDQARRPRLIPAEVRRGTRGCGHWRPWAVTVPLFLLLFASTYMVLAALSVRSFSQPMSHTAALYFAVTARDRGSAITARPPARE